MAKHRKSSPGVTFQPFSSSKLDASVCDSMSSAHISCNLSEEEVPNILYFEISSNSWSFFHSNSPKTYGSKVGFYFPFTFIRKFDAFLKPWALYSENFKNEPTFCPLSFINPSNSPCDGKSNKIFRNSNANMSLNGLNISTFACINLTSNSKVNSKSKFESPDLNSNDRILSSDAVRRTEDDLKDIFDEIDENHDGQLSVDEIKSYALKKSLPTNYVHEFLGNARKRRFSRFWRREKNLNKINICIQKARDSFLNVIDNFFIPSSKRNTVNFIEFKEFVEAKDYAIRRSFNYIDSNHDNKITMDDLENGLKCVRILCPRTGYYAPVKQNCILNMMKIMNKGKDDVITYHEFRDFFTLLPSSAYIMDYWMAASCQSPTSNGVDIGSCVQMRMKFNTTNSSSPLSSSSSTSSSSSSAAAAAAASSSSNDDDVQDQINRNAWTHLIAGALAGATSRTATAPLEALRLKMMVTGNKGMINTAQQIFAEAGWKSFYKGNVTNVIRSAPQKAIDFFAFESYKNMLRRTSGSMPLVTAGALAGATSTLILYPLDVVRSRLTVATHPQYNSIIDALVNIPKNEGVASLYRGLTPSLLSIMPEAAITYGCFDLLKNLYKRIKKTDEIHVMPALACGVISAFTGQLVAFPLELIARRFQMGVKNSSTSSSSSIFSTIKMIVKEEGMGGLYRGIVPSSIKVIPMAIVSFGVYEFSKSFISSLMNEMEMERLRVEALKRERRLRHSLIMSSNCKME